MDDDTEWVPPNGATSRDKATRDDQVESDPPPNADQSDWEVVVVENISYAAGGDIHSVIAVAQYVAGAVAAGVVGNLASDWLKQVVRHRPEDAVQANDAQLLQAQVLQAVVEQCRIYELAAPDVDRMQITDWSSDRLGVTAAVASLDSPLVASVFLPHDGSPIPFVQVRIRDTSQLEAIERVAEQQYAAKYGTATRGLGAGWPGQKTPRTLLPSYPGVQTYQPGGGRGPIRWWVVVLATVVLVAIIVCIVLTQ